MTWIDEHEDLARQAWRARAHADAAAARYGDLDDCAAGLARLAQLGGPDAAQRAIDLARQHGGA